MKKLVLIGAGGHAEACLDVVETTGKFSIMGFLDAKIPAGESFCGYSILGSDSYLDELCQLPEVCFLITIGQIKSPDTRIDLYKKLKVLGAKLATVISPRSYVSPRSLIGEGTIVMHDTLVNAGVIIGKNCILNSKSLIEHNSVVGDHCHISTGAIINGNCKVDEGSFLGSGSILKQGSVLGRNSFLQANEFYKSRS